MENNTPDRTADGNGKVISCVMRGDTAYSRLTVRLSPQEWRGVVAACAFGTRTPEQVIKAAIRHDLTRLGIIQEPKIAPGEASAIPAENRVTVMSRNGGILRQFVCSIQGWAFDALQFAAQNDGAPIGQTCAAAIYHFAAHRGIEPPRRMKAEVDAIAERAKLAENTDVPELVRSADGSFRRLLTLKKWERDAARAVANHDGVPVGKIIAHALRYYVNVRGVELPPEHVEAVERVRTARDCAFVKLRSHAASPADAAAVPESSAPAPAEAVTGEENEK